VALAAEGYFREVAALVAALARLSKMVALAGLAGPLAAMAKFQVLVVALAVAVAGALLEVLA
jgi:hypothetical protein